MKNMYATSDMSSRWENIDFQKASRHVQKLQKRIGIAFSIGAFDKALSLQHKLIHSFYAKALAVKRVTTTHGKHTAGVDNVIWKTPEQKFNAIADLTFRGYKPKALKRRYIPKQNGKKRPLSIPTMKDRAMQTLYMFALEPIVEVTGDKHSYGFRKKRSAKKAVKACLDLLRGNPNYRWVLKADIKSCFDNINHEWLMSQIPMDKKSLRQFLKCGYVYNGKFTPVERGVPQGGSLSGILCNMTLDGLENVLREKFEHSVQMVRYADDIIVIADSLQKVQAVVPIINNFLRVRGLSLSHEKTKCCDVRKGFTFLGYKIYEKDGRVLAEPKGANIESILKKLTNEIESRNEDSFYSMMNSLKSIIRGWLNYYEGIATQSSIDNVECRMIKLIESHCTDNSL